MSSARSRTLHVLVLLLAAVTANASTRPCPRGCLCVQKTVRCMFLKLNFVPEIPEDTTLLDLRFNNIRHIPNNAFQDLHHLDVLLLDSNEIQKIDNHTFRDLKSLRHLFLSKNRIRHLDEDAFSGLQQLEQLSLHENELGEIAEAPFAGLLSLERLHLNDNRIRTVQKGALQNLSQLRRLRLDGNPLTCDCGLVWFSLMLREKQTITQATGLCAQPEPLRGRALTSLDSSDFACGDLRHAEWHYASQASRDYWL